MKTNRKDELLSELQKINQKELKEKVDKIGYTKTPEQRAHSFVMRGDFIIKFVFALGILASFVWIVYTGNVDAMDVKDPYALTSKSSGNFQLLSVVGPLAGMILQYYFGKNKAGANGE